MSDAVLIALITVGVTVVTAIINGVFSGGNIRQNNTGQAEIALRDDLFARLENLEKQVSDLRIELATMTQKYLKKYGEAERLRAQRDSARDRCNEAERRGGLPLSPWHIDPPEEEI